MLFHWQKIMARKGTRSDANERHAHPLSRTVWHGPIKIGVSVSRSVAASISMLMESCTIYFYFLNFYCSRVCIRICTQMESPLKATVGKITYSCFLCSLCEAFCFISLLVCFLSFKSSSISNKTFFFSLVFNVSSWQNQMI